MLELFVQLQHVLQCVAVDSRSLEYGQMLYALCKLLKRTHH